MLGFIRRNALWPSAALALGLAASPTAAETIGSATTDYSTKSCAHKPGRAVEDYGEWRCKGLGGIAILVSAGDQRMTMSFGPRAKDEPAAAQTLSGFNDIYKARIEWRFVRNGKPFAAIVTWSTALLDESPGSLDLPRPKMIKGKVLVVMRLGPGGVCHAGYVDALANPDADTLARTIADERARAFRCGTDKPVILGATGPGFSSSADAEKIQ
jgi:hypothetical protein